MTVKLLNSECACMSDGPLKCKILAKPLFLMHSEVSTLCQVGDLRLHTQSGTRQHVTALVIAVSQYQAENVSL